MARDGSRLGSQPRGRLGHGEDQDRAADRDPQDPARRDHHAGEPLVRQLLRHVSRAPTGFRPACASPIRVNGGCVAPFHDPSDVNYGGPHARQQRASPTSTAARMDGFVAQAEQGMGCSTRATRTAARAPRPARRASLPSCVDVMGYHDAREIPNYWTYAENYVLQDHMFEPNDSWSLPAHLYMVSEWSAFCTNPLRPVVVSRRRPEPQPRLDAHRELLDAQQRPAALRLDRHHLPAAPAERPAGPTTCSRAPSPTARTTPR